VRSAANKGPIAFHHHRRRRSREIRAFANGY